MSNVVDNRGTTRFITKPRMDIYVKSSHLITEQLNQLSIVNIFLSSCIDLSKGIRHILKTGEVHKRRPARSAYAGEASQQAGLPKVKRRNRRTPDWQMKLYPGEFCNPLDNIILQDIQGLIQKFY